jgi:hypothetical protein
MSMVYVLQFNNPPVENWVDVAESHSKDALEKQARKYNKEANANRLADTHRVAIQFR